MSGVLEDLRELSRRSRRAQAAGFVAMLGSLVAMGVAGIARTSWVVMVATTVAGALFVHYAWRQGEERGAFRRVLRDHRRALGRKSKEEGG